MRGIFALFLGLLLVTTANSQFTNLAPTQGMSLINNNPLHGNGISFVDVEGDGLDDITFASKYQGIQYWKNLDGANFQLTPLSCTPAIPLNIDIKAVLWVDYDNDGDKDLIYSGIQTPGVGNYPLKVYNNNGNMVFTDVSTSIGILTENPMIVGVSAGDYNNDGWLDLFVCKYHNADFFEGYEYSNRLYKNDGDGTFTDVTLSAGLPTPIQASFMGVFFDYDRDGWQDIYVINDRFQYQNYLYHNKGDGTFEDVSDESGAGIYIEAMSGTVGDYDRDGDQDVFVPNTTTGNYLLNNQNNGTFINVGEFAGIQVFKVCWGSLWLDYDNDGWKDLFISSVGSGTTVQDANLAFRNNANGTFSDVTGALSLANNNDGTYCMAMGDYNNDGYYDFLQNNVGTATDFYSNSGGDNNYLCCTFEGTISNKEGVGTWIDCWSEQGYQNHYTHCGENYICQNTKKEIFGLGEDLMVDSLKIYWLSGLVETYYNLEANQCIHFVEGASTSNLSATLSYSGDLFICPGESIVFTSEEAESYLWSTGATDQAITITEPDTLTLTITNEFGIEQISAEYIISWAPIPSWSSETTDITCQGLGNGTASIIYNDEELVSILWENGEETAEINELDPGVYSFVLTDSYGCTHADSVTVVEPEILQMNLSYTDVLCFGDNTGTASVEALGGNGEPYFISWGENVDPSALAAGEYTVVITDPMNCLIEQTFEIVEPDELTATVVSTLIDEDNPQSIAEVDILGGTAPYDITWSNGDTNELFADSLNAGYNSVLITDSNDCTFEVIFEVLVGINELNKLETFTVYPNPSEGLTTISSSASMTSIEVTDVSGKVVKLIEFSPCKQVTIDFSQFSQGVYVVSGYSNKEKISAATLVVGD